LAGMICACKLGVQGVPSLWHAARTRRVLF
jgi:hypothetical protein